MDEVIQWLRMNMVKADFMTRKQYCEKRGWEVPTNENPDEEVMMVTYADGYVSMCPYAKFTETSVPTGYGVPFGYAITMCQYRGKRIKRVGWNGEDQYVEYRECAILMKSEETMLESTSNCFVFHFKNRKTGETGIQVGWLASQADMAANDWVVID